MSDEGHRVVTEEQRERLYAARRRGGMCAWCGKTLGDEELVYVERFLMGSRPPRGSTVVAYASVAWGPVGPECASPDLLDRTAGTEPERCAGCGRGMHYRQSRSIRHQASCSQRCAARTSAAKRAARRGTEG